MNICIFAKSLPVHITGGMEIHTELLINGLAQRGHQVTVITAPHPEGVVHETLHNINIHYLSSRPKYDRGKFYKESSKLFTKLNSYKIYDIVHSQSSLGTGYAKYCKKTAPLVVTLHGTGINEIKTVLKGEASSMKSIFAVPIWMKMSLLDDPLLFKKSDKIITVSNEICEDVKRQYNIPEKKLVVIPNGIDISKLRPIKVDGLRERWDLTDQQVILSVGNIRKIKGYHLLLKVLPEILCEKRVKLFIVGVGEYLDELKTMAKRLGITDDVIFFGKVSDEDLLQLYNVSDLFVLPTLWHSEAFGLVNAEAMACEKPVISSNIGGVPTVIENYVDGLLIEPGNLKELKEKILEVLDDDDLARRLGRNARRKVIERFSIDKMVEDTIKVYEDAICGE
jgi:glycosyltransferase involved in cell wall biosynthesis